MKVAIKDLAVKSLEIGSKGIEIDLSDKDGHTGDLYITNTKLIWCVGKTRKENGVSLSWGEFTEIMKSKEAKKAAILAAKSH